MENPPAGCPQECTGGCPQGRGAGSTAGRRKATISRVDSDYAGLDEVARGQAGVVTRAQVFACGLSKAQLAGQVIAGRWQRIHRGVYATFNGPLPRRSVLWAALLRAGPGAVLSHETAAELVGLSERPSRRVHVTVPERRSPARIAGVVTHRATHAEVIRHPTRMPPQTRIEDTVVDLTQTAAHVEDAISWLARAIGSRLTTVPRLLARFQARPKLRWRALLYAALGDVEAGCHSLIELKYLRDVERAHGLPRSQRQARREAPSDVGSQYDDVRYRRYATRVELDGLAAHPEHERWRDMRRDNAAVIEGDRVLRYGLWDVDSHACQLAVQVASVLRTGGWRGLPRRCTRPDCAIP
jgi:hypothetical protein